MLNQMIQVPEQQHVKWQSYSRFSRSKVNRNMVYSTVYLVIFVSAYFHEWLKLSSKEFLVILFFVNPLYS